MSDKYNRIVAALRKASLQSVEDALDRAVTEEKRALFSINRLRDNGRAAMAAAMEFYADEIADELRKYDGVPLDAPGEELPGVKPNDVLSNRRKPTVWAVARLMFEAGITLADIGQGDVDPDAQCPEHGCSRHRCDEEHS